MSKSDISQKEDTTKSLIGSITGSVKPYKDYIVDSGEFAYKNLVESDVLKEFPIVKWIAGTYNVVDKLQFRRLKRNAEAFLDGISDADPDNIDRLRDSLFEDKKFYDEFQDVISEIIIESSRPLRAKLLGNLVSALADNKIDKESFERITQIVYGASIPALRALPKFFTRNGGQSYERGIRSIEEEALIMSIGLAVRSGTMFRIEPDGVILWELGFKQTNLD